MGATLYMSTPLLGGGPVKPVVVGVAELILMILSAYPGVAGWNPGDPSGFPPNVLRPGDASGWPP